MRAFGVFTIPTYLTRESAADNGLSPFAGGSFPVGLMRNAFTRLGVLSSKAGPSTVVHWCPRSLLIRLSASGIWNLGV